MNNASRVEGRRVRQGLLKAARLLASARSEYAASLVYALDKVAGHDHALHAAMRSAVLAASGGWTLNYWRGPALSPDVTEADVLILAAEAAVREGRRVE